MGHLWAHCRPINNVQSNLILATAALPKKQKTFEFMWQRLKFICCNDYVQLAMAMAMAMEIGVCSALYKVPLTHFGPVSGQAESQALTDTTHTHAKGSYPLACKVFCQPTNNVNGRMFPGRELGPMHRRLVHHLAAAHQRLFIRSWKLGFIYIYGILN